MKDCFEYMTNKSPVLALMKMRSEVLCGHDKEDNECYDQDLGYEELVKFHKDPYERNKTLNEKP